VAQLKVFIVLFLLIFLSGCTAAWNNAVRSNTDHNVSSSLLDYLYPNGQTGTPASVLHKPVAATKLNHSNKQTGSDGTTQFWTSDLGGKNANVVTGKPSPPQASNPLPLKKPVSVSSLTLPLHVGLAFIPSKGNIPGLSEARKVLLLDRVKQKFQQYPFVSQVQIIPEMYFKSGKGIEHVAQIGKRFNLDTIALVSYDQVVHTDDNKLSLLYLTIVGAYVVNGSDFDTQTFVDTAVFDVKSRQLLFRVPGVDNAITSTTLVGSAQKKRNIRYASFEAAFNNMVAKFDDEISHFKQRAIMKDADSSMPRVDGNGAGSFNLVLLVLITCFALIRGQGIRTPLSLTH